MHSPTNLHRIVPEFLNGRFRRRPGLQARCPLVDLDTNRVLYDKLTYIYLEMPKFNKVVDDLSGFTDCWLYIIKNLAKLDEKPKALRDRVFERFFKVAEIANFTTQQRTAYEASLKSMRDYNNTITSAEDKGIQKGLEQGRAEGRAEGLAEGINEGARNKSFEIARNMLKLGLPISDVAAVTGLSEDDL